MNDYPYDNNTATTAMDVWGTLDDDMFTMTVEDQEIWSAAASLFLEEDDHMTDLNGNLNLNLNMDHNQHHYDHSAGSRACSPPLFDGELMDMDTSIKEETNEFMSLMMNQDAGKQHHQHHQQQPTTRRVNRRREEILFLRDQVQSLQERLSSTRVRMEERTELGRYLEPTERELLTTAWSAVAAQQREQREKSEAEHDRLVAMIEEQRQLAKALQRYARRQHPQTIPTPLAVYAHLEELQQDVTALDTTGSFDDLQRAITSMYYQRDAVFSDPRFSDVLSSVRVSRVVNEHTPRVCVELLDARILPFDVQTTANAMWESMVHRVATTVTYDKESSEIQSDQLKKSFVAMLDLPQFQTSVRGKVVVHRIIEPARIVILRATQFAPIDLTNSGAEPFLTSHYQWTVIEAPRHERLRRSNKALAQIQSFDLSFPKPTSTSATGSASTAPMVTSSTSPSSLSSTQEQVMVDFCETAVAHHLDLSRQAVENILVSRSLGDTHLPSQVYRSTDHKPAIKLEAC